MKVWVVTLLGWEYNYVKGVFGSKEKAEAFAASTPSLAMYPGENEWVVEEHTLDAPYDYGDDDD